MKPSYDDLAAENCWLKEQLEIIRSTPLIDPLKARLQLSPTEVRLLSLLRARGEATRDSIYVAVFQRLDGDGPGVKIIDVVVCKIRKKLAARGAPGTIRNVWGLGYRLDAELKAWLDDQADADGSGRQEDLGIAA